MNTVAIAGRPNVGKSTLFNRLKDGGAGAIVSGAAGTTRDRLYAVSNWRGVDFTLIDTGGLDFNSKDLLLKQIIKQAEIAVLNADVVIFLTDCKAGLTDDDEKCAAFLRRAKKPIVLAVNKTDDIKNNADFYAFYALGLGEPIPISAGSGLNIGDLLDEVVKKLPPQGLPPEAPNAVRVAFIGRPNVGKSTLVNKILGDERMIVSDIPGTTRDAADTPCRIDGFDYVLTDTAGLRRQAKVKEQNETYARARAAAAVKASDVCLCLISAPDGVNEADVKTASLAHNAGKPSCVVINKWDIMEKDGKTAANFSKDIDEKLKFMTYAPKIFLSAKTGQRLNKLFPLARTVYQNARARVSTSVLNEAVMEAVAVSPPKPFKGKTARIFYASQVAVSPPTFVLFVNNEKLLHYTYKRFIENRIRENFCYAGTPIVILTRNRA